MCESVNKELIPIKAHYFLFNAATGPIVPFLPTIGRQLGFNAISMGTINTVLPISGLIAKPLFSSLADKFKLHKTFFLMFQVILTIGFFCINFIPPMEKSANVVYICNKGLAFLEVCSKKEFSTNLQEDLLHASQSNARCKLSCRNLSKEDYNELCSEWHKTEFCAVNNTDDSTERQIDFSVTLDMPESLYEKCGYLRVRNIDFPNGTILPPMCYTHIRPSCLTTCHNSALLNQLLQEVDTPAGAKPQWKTAAYQFHLFLWAAVVSWVGMAVVVSIADAICFNLLGNDKRKEYGKQKMWGSIGFGIFGISAGYLVDVFSKGQTEKDYSCIFYVMLIAMILDIVVSATLKKKIPEYSDEPSSNFSELFALAREFQVLAFAWWCIGAGMCTGVIWNFLFWYTEDLAKQTAWLKTLQGLLTGVQCFLGELPFNFMSGALLKKLGHINVMSIVLLIYAVRFMAYSMVKNPWMFLLLELLHGPSLGLCWPTMVSYGDKVTPAGTKATIQGFIGAIFEGIGVSGGSLLCGWLFDTYGGAVTFRVFSVGALLWLAGFWIMQLLLRKAKAYPMHHGHNHLVNYANPDDAILMMMSQELQTY